MIVSLVALLQNDHRLLATLPPYRSSYRLQALGKRSESLDQQQAE
jgi:hypothetical protein